MKFANTPDAPYYAVIFSSQVTDTESEEYAEVSKKMVELAEQQPGFLGIESARDPAGFA